MNITKENWHDVCEGLGLMAVGQSLLVVATLPWCVHLPTPLIVPEIGITSVSGIASTVFTTFGVLALFNGLKSMIVSK